MLKLFFILSVVCLCLQLIVAQTFQQQCLDAHNYYRKQHGAPDLKLDDTLQQFAQQWANYLAQTGKFEHRPNNKYGENLYALFGSTDVTGAQAVKAWYDEINLYDFNNPGFSMKTGHFTQVVWKGSQNMGCAIAKRGQNAYVVANYDPPGNFIGRFPANVLRKQQN